MFLPEREGIAYADIDLEDIIDYKYGFDAAGHYRNQYLTLNFYREPHPFCNYIGDGKQEPIRTTPCSPEPLRIQRNKQTPTCDTEGSLETGFLF